MVEPFSHLILLLLRCNFFLVDTKFIGSFLTFDKILFRYNEGPTKVPRGKGICVMLTVSIHFMFYEITIPSLQKGYRILFVNVMELVLFRLRCNPECLDIWFSREVLLGQLRISYVA